MALNYCTRCGIDFELSEDAYTARRTRNVENPDWCADCRGFNPKSDCRAWKGDVTEDFQPMLRGKPYLPGWRLCGRVDCVNKTHIEGYEATPAKPKPVGQPCIEPDCERIQLSMGKCSMHYRRENRLLGSQRRTAERLNEAMLYWTENPQRLYCGVPTCGDQHRAKGLCYRHWRLVWTALTKVAA